MPKLKKKKKENKTKKLKFYFKKMYSFKCRRSQFCQSILKVAIQNKYPQNINLRIGKFNIHSSGLKELWIVMYLLCSQLIQTWIAAEGLMCLSWWPSLDNYQIYVRFCDSVQIICTINCSLWKLAPKLCQLLELMQEKVKKYKRRAPN